ncbi:hypothetical protein TNCV_4483181 [Trichonephila clavipes]|nr:hypothetical protein TNCV_4483181 [Trichonephila clavipes]
MVGNLISAIDKDPSLLDGIVTGVKKWIFCTAHYPREYLQRRHNHILHANIGSAKTVKGKVMQQVFFDIQGILHLVFISEGYTVNKETYVDILSHLRESIRKKRPEFRA